MHLDELNPKSKLKIHFEGQRQKIQENHFSRMVSHVIYRHCTSHVFGVCHVISQILIRSDYTGPVG